MTPAAPRRLLLVASDATPRGDAAPIRRYRLARVLMRVDDLLALGSAGRGDAAPAPARAARREHARVETARA